MHYCMVDFLFSFLQKHEMLREEDNVHDLFGGLQREKARAAHNRIRVVSFPSL